MSERRAASVSVTRRVRPIRFAFLIDPSNRRQLQKAIQLNTILWGGRFNPLIPAYRRTPPSWVDKPLQPPSAREVIAGYLMAFDPDVVVNLTRRNILLKGFEQNVHAERRILTLADVFDPKDRDSPVRYGLDVSGLYQHLYEEEYRFQPRDAPRVVLPVVRERKLKPLLDVISGTFPPEPEYFLKDYKDAFSPEILEVNIKNLLELFTRDWACPLRIGSAFIRTDRGRSRARDLTLFYMDPHSTLDLIDYWNLRAAGWQVFPIPRQWADHMVEGCRNVIAQAYQPYRHNPAMMHHTTLLKARSASEADIREFAASLKLPKNDMLSIQLWYPRIWDDRAREKDFVVPASVYSEDETIEAQSSDDSLSFKAKKPEFADDVCFHGNPRWANEVRLKRYDADTERAEVIPPGLPRIDRALNAVGLPPVRAGRDALVIPCQYGGGSHHWTLPSSLKIFEAWAEQQGYKFSLSSAGLITHQMLRQIEGVFGAWLFADSQVLRLLNEMSGGKVVPVGEMANRLFAPQSRRLPRLVEVNALRIGIQLQCKYCQ